MPLYGCECSGIKRTHLGGYDCIGEVKKCYKYFENSNIEGKDFWQLYNEDRYHSDFEVSCDDFPQ